MLPEKWQEVPIGCHIPQTGSSTQYVTGTWRSQRPTLDTSKCSNCLLCWVFCPEGAIQIEEDKVKGMDLRYCKGCGICATECPRKAIDMVEEPMTLKGA